MMRYATRKFVCLGLTLLSVFAIAAEAEAQNRRRGRSYDVTHTRNNERMRQLFAPVVAGATASTVRVFCKDRQVALGTVVGANGLIATKASELDGDVEVRIGEDAFPAKVLGQDEPNDLALLRIEKNGLRKVALAIENETRVGNFVVTAAHSGMPISYGVMSVKRHPRRARTFLGVRGEDDRRGVLLTEVMKDTAAAAAGLEKDDVVLSAAGKKIDRWMTLIQVIQKQQPGVALPIKVRRGDKELEVVAKLRTDSSDRHGPISSQERSRLWGPLSKVRLGFQEVIQHDGVIQPKHCGGPLVNTSGEVVGINISRVGRFETVALTSKIVATSIARILSRR